jgi:hypothetical protein
MFVLLSVLLSPVASGNEGAVPSARPPQGADHPVPSESMPSRPIQPDPLTIRPVGEVRLDLDLSQIGGAPANSRRAGPSQRFGVSRVELGLESSVSEHLETRTVMHAAQASELLELQAGQQIERYPTGWAVQAQDVYATLLPFDGDHFWVRAGVQMTLLGSRNLFDEARGEYYLVGPRTEELAELAGVVHGRDLGLRVHGQVFEGLAVDGMVANGGGHTGTEAADQVQDLSARLAYAPTESIQLVASAQRSGEDSDVSAAWSLMGEWRGERVRALTEAIGGDEVPGQDGPFLGGQAGLAIEREHAGGVVQTQVLSTRLGYLDPQIKTDDADAWLTADLSLQGWWSARSPAGVMTGVGYSMWMPMSIAEPVTHSLRLQALFQL